MKDKHAVIDDQLRETPGRSDSWLADDLGVDRKTVQGRRKRLAGVDREIPDQSRVDFTFLPETVATRPFSRHPKGTVETHNLRKQVDEELARRDAEEAERKGVRRGQGERNDRTSTTFVEVAEQQGVHPNTARNRSALAEELGEHLTLRAWVDGGLGSYRDGIGTALASRRLRRRQHVLSVGRGGLVYEVGMGISRTVLKIPQRASNHVPRDTQLLPDPLLRPPGAGQQRGAARSA